MCTRRPHNMINLFRGTLLNIQSNYRAPVSKSTENFLASELVMSTNIIQIQIHFFFKQIQYRGNWVEWRIADNASNWLKDRLYRASRDHYTSVCSSVGGGDYAVICCVMSAYIQFHLFYSNSSLNQPQPGCIARDANKSLSFLTTASHTYCVGTNCYTMTVQLYTSPPLPLLNLFK